MRYWNITVIVSSLILMSFSREGDELEAIERLMSLTEQQLQAQKELKDHVVLFKAQQDAFFNGTQTKEHVSRMVTTASDILKIIEAHNYRHLFSLLYLQEIEMFANIANKKGPARP